MSEFFATNVGTPLNPKLMFHSVLYYFCAFGTVRLRYKTQCETGQTVAKSSCHEVASEFFATNATDPPHWNLNSCFCVYCTIWMHSGPFGCLTKLDVKRAEVVQKFVPWSRVGSFRNKRTRSTLLDPYLMFIAFRTIWVHLGEFVALQHSVQNRLN